MNKTSSAGKPHFYVLDTDGETPVEVYSGDEWAAWFWNADNEVANVELVSADNQTISIITIFLGVDPYEVEDPLLFETTIWGGPHDGWARRYETFQDARRGHEEILGTHVTEGYIVRVTHR